MLNFSFQVVSTNGPGLFYFFPIKVTSFSRFSNYAVMLQGWIQEVLKGGGGGPNFSSSVLNLLYS